MTNLYRTCLFIPVLGALSGTLTAAPPPAVCDKLDADGIAVPACEQSATESRFERFHFDARSGSSVYHANHDARGIPLDLLPEVPVSAALLDRIAVALPESRDVRDAEINLITDDAGGNITLREDADVFVTFLHEAAGYKNSFGYIAYPVNDPPERPEDAAHIVVFPNASHAGSGGSERGLRPGQQVFLGTFPAGTRISFFVVADGWSSTGVEPLGDDWVFYTLQGLNPEPGELAAHTVLLHDPDEQKTILGMEDIHRENPSCDHDFNDMLFAIESNPPSAIDTDDLLELNQVADRDGDGVPDGEDELPDDPLGAFVASYPNADGHATLAFEDNWPYRGDYDLNDLVLRYRMDEIRDAYGDVTAIRGRFEMMGRGAGYSTGFGLHFPGIPPEALAHAEVVIDAGEPVALSSESGQSELTLILVENTKDLGHHSHWCWFFNTEDCDEVKPTPFSFELVFAEPVPQAQLGDAPYNPFLYLASHRWHEVHLPNRPPTDLVGPWLIGTGEDASDPDAGRHFLSQTGLPWALNLPVDWHHPRERIDITEAYPAFATWVESGGTEAVDWYLRENADATKLFERTLTSADEQP